MEPMSPLAAPRRRVHIALILFVQQNTVEFGSANYSGNAVPVSPSTYKNPLLSRRNS